jgi:hypothetical protein
MKRIIVPLITVLAIVAGTAIPAHAEDFRCKDSTGCLAQVSENGELKTVAFRRGDLISTKDGWIVDPNQGWKKIRVQRVES